jgi:mRNA interferase MazF
MARVLRGDVLWAQLNPVRGHEQAGQRPVVVLIQDIFNERSGTIIVMAITSQPQRAQFPLTLEVPEGLGLPKKSWVKISQVRTLSTERLGKRISRLPRETVDLLEGLNEIIAA